MNFNGQGPILITSTSSLEYLNSQLVEKVPMNRFRMNIVISGSKSYEEIHWKKI